MMIHGLLKAWLPESKIIFEEHVITDLLVIEEV